MTIQLGIINRGSAAALSGGAWQPLLPIANLQRAGLVYSARSVDAALVSTKFALDFGNTTTLVRLFGIMRHNLSTAALYRITGGTSAGASDRYNSGWLSVWPRVYGPLDLDFEEPNWYTGQISAEDVALYPIKLLHDLGGNFLVRYWTIEFNDTANAAGYVQLTRLFAGPLWQPAINYVPGAGVAWASRDRGIETRSGARYFDRLMPKRVMSFAFDALSDAEAWGRALDLQRRLGSEGELLVIPDPANLAQRHRRDLWARVTRAAPVAETEFADVQQWSIEVEELI
jgi:hypothetical protein